MSIGPDADPAGPVAPDESPLRTTTRRSANSNVPGCFARWNVTIGRPLGTSSSIVQRCSCRCQASSFNVTSARPYCFHCGSLWARYSGISPAPFTARTA